jgi:micrococcal nuclease
MPTRRRSAVLSGICATLLAALALEGGRPEAAHAEELKRVEVPYAALTFDDGDSVVIHWKPGEVETVRILGIDTPEVQHVEHDIPHAQPFGAEAAGFLGGCLAVADKIELARAAEKDRYGRTLGYLFANGKNVSVLLLQARLAVESVSRYGDNGFPDEAAECLAAAKAAGPVPFEDPDAYRQRMRALSAWLKARGLYPALPQPAPK